MLESVSLGGRLEVLKTHAIFVFALSALCCRLPRCGPEQRQTCSSGKGPSW